MADEVRTLDVNVEDVRTEGNTLRGYAAIFNTLSEDLGGFRERIAPGAFADVLADADVRLLVDHKPPPLARTKAGTLRLSEDERGLSFAAELPDTSYARDLRESVKRGDLDGMSFRFAVKPDGEEWQDDVRTIRRVDRLMDVCLATYPAYPAASVELRTRPNPETEEHGPMEQENREGGLAVEDRSAVSSEPNIEQRVMDAMRSVRKGESRDLTTTSAEPITPPELSAFLWDKLRPVSVALASGLRVIPSDREKVVWPRLTADVAPDWIAEADEIPAGDPTFGTLEAEPKKLAHRVELSNEVIDDSEPSVIDVLNSHVVTMLALKLDRSIYEGNPTADPESIRGLRFVSGIQEVDMEDAALTDYDPLVEAVGLLRAANVPAPYAVVMHPRTLTELELLKDESGSNRQLARPEGLPPIFTTSQLSITEPTEEATPQTIATSIYVYSPQRIVLVRRQDATVELDRSRLFHTDQSELRAKARADLIVPDPVAVVRIKGVTPPA